MKLTNKKRKRNVILNQGQVSQQKKKKGSCVRSNIDFRFDFHFLNTFILLYFLFLGEGGCHFLKSRGRLIEFTLFPHGTPQFGRAGRDVSRDMNFAFFHSPVQCLLTRTLFGNIYLFYVYDVDFISHLELGSLFSNSLLLFTLNGALRGHD